jgi:hypothetical protein
MELIIPKATPLAQLELFQKRMIKQILSLPIRTADPAVYILSGLLPITVDLQYWVQFPFFQINTAQIPKAIIIWSRLYNWLAPIQRKY